MPQFVSEIKKQKQLQTRTPEIFRDTIVSKTLYSASPVSIFFNEIERNF